MGFRLLITGCAGFIGSALAHHAALDFGWSVVGIDVMTYVANCGAIAALDGNPKFKLVVADITELDAMAAVFTKAQPEAVAHVAAETHVDRSSDNPEAFLTTNVVGAQRIARAAPAYWERLSSSSASRFRLLHVSSGQVFGALYPDGSFKEDSPFAPRPPMPPARPPAATSLAPSTRLSAYRC